MANEVFISYSRKDYKKVSKIKKEIDSKVGINCWMDLDGIEGGDALHRNITSAINRHDTVLFMQSKNSMKSDWALKELGYAESKGKRIILVNIDDSKMTDDFLFAFQTKNNIIWSNSLQRDLLIRNLRSWHCNYSQNTSSTNDYSSTSNSLLSNNTLLVTIGFISFLVALYFTIKEKGEGHGFSGYFVCFSCLLAIFANAKEKKGDTDTAAGLRYSAFWGLCLIGVIFIGKYFKSIWLAILLGVLIIIILFLIRVLRDWNNDD